MLSADERAFSAAKIIARLASIFSLVINKIIYLLFKEL
jgi:hypothetical protein